MKRVLFVAYGSGHIKMLIPEAQALQASGRAQPVVLALTTAAPVARAAGLDVVQFKDFVQPGDEAALTRGRQLVQDLGGAVSDPDESAAYLGLSYADLEADLGTGAAEAEYRRRGRQAFLPVRTLTRILQTLRPDVVVATNAPRGERAAIVAAGPLANLVLAIALFGMVNWMGVEEPRALLGAPLPGSVAERAGMRAGDWVQASSRDGQDWQELQSLPQLRWRLAQAVEAGEPLYLSVSDSQGHAQRELLLDTVVQNTPVALVLTDAGEHVVYANSAARQLLAAGRSLQGADFAALLAAAPPAPRRCGRSSAGAPTGIPLCHTRSR